MILETQSTTEVTPELLAKAFWDMGATEQARFWSAVKDEATKSEGDMAQYRMQVQSHFMCAELSNQGRDALMTLAAPVFMHTLIATNNW